ncbi:hypothetical protein [Desulfosporosinus fructosivorans]
MISIEKIYGTMVGIHVDKQTFAFKSLEDENMIGEFSDDFDGVTFEVPKIVEAEIERRVTFLVQGVKSIRFLKFRTL